MASRKIVEIFLASPRDLKDERKNAKNIVDNFNRQWADFTGIQVELVGWEDTTSRYGRPQETINQELDRCEAFIGMMWRRWGTPPDNNGKYSSGFEEEFERAVASRKATGRPEISLYFKDIEEELLENPNDDIKRVVDFKEKVIAEKQILFESFKTPQEFEECISNCVRRYVQKLKRDEAQQNKDDTKGRTADEPVETEEGEELRSHYNPLSEEGTKFMRALLDKADRGGPSDSISAVEIARLRLLSTLIGSSSNDSTPLGTHDANLLFAHRDEMEFSYQERRGLIESGLEYLKHETVPLWHWIKSSENSLSIYSIIGSPVQRAGALSAMRIVGAPIVPLPPIEGYENSGTTREEFIKSWLSATTDQIRIAGLEYLSFFGDASDLPSVKDVLDRGDYQTKGAAVDAIIRINLRQGREQALRALNELQPESVEADLVDDLFSKSAALSTELLQEGIIHRSSKVRARIVSILFDRKALTPGAAEQLLDDGEAAVRFAALASLIRDGREFSDEKAKEILVKPSRGGGGLGALFGYGGHPMPDRDGEANWALYQRRKFRALSLPVLEKLAATETILNQGPRFALAVKRFKKSGEALRTSVDDQFKAEYDAAVTDFEKRLNADSVTRFKSMEETFRKGLTRSGTDVLCEIDDPADLRRIRKLVSENFIDFSDADVAYLGKHGEWSDIPLLISLTDRRDSSGTTLLGGLFDSERLSVIASALYLIAKGRFGELVELTMPSGLKSRVIGHAKDSEISSLTDSQIIALLSSKADEERKATLLRISKALSKRRLLIGAAVLDSFIGKLRRRSCTTGILVAANGVTGGFVHGDGNEVGAIGLITSALQEGIRVIVITSQDLAAIASVDDLRELIKRRYCGLYVHRVF